MPGNPGSKQWYETEAVYAKGGTVDTILDLVLSEEISQDKARELIQHATDVWARSSQSPPPWPNRRK